MHKPYARRIAAHALILGLAALAPLAAAQAQAWPAQPLKAIVPFGPGSSPDQVARIVGEKAGAILGQSIVIENKPGASGNIGTYAIANAKPDGYTFGVSITGPLVNNTLLFDKLPYAPATDLAPLTLAVHQPNVLVVPASAGIDNIGQLLEALKKNSDKYNFPSTGAGTVSHLAVELMLQQTGARATHVPAHRRHAHGEGWTPEGPGRHLVQALGPAARHPDAGRSRRAGHRGLGVDRLRDLVQGSRRHPEEAVRRADPGHP
jgi:tripartite-type tricarboxylate transporter receptor subunit TctC